MAFSHTTETVFQRPQLGVETSWGTDAAATIALYATRATLSRKVTMNRFRATGYTFPVASAGGREWSEIALETIPGYSSNGDATHVGGDLDYFISSINGDTAVAAPVSYTVETGGQQVTGAIVKGWEISGNNDSCVVNTSMIGKKAETATATGALSPTVNTAFPPSAVTLTVAGGPISNWISYRISVDNIWGVCHFLGDNDVANILQPGDTVGDFEYTVEADSDGLTPLGYVDAGAKTIVWKLETGTTPTKYTLQLTFDVNYEEPTEFHDEGGVYAITHKAAIVWKTTNVITVVKSKS